MKTQTDFISIDGLRSDQKCIVCFKGISPTESGTVIESNNAYHGQCYKDRLKPKCGGCFQVNSVLQIDFKLNRTNYFNNIYLGQIIQSKSKQIQYKDHKFHLDCFKCNKCQSSLGGEKFLTKADEPYCLECFKSLFVVSCHQCFEPIRRLSKCTDINGLHYHGECLQLFYSTQEI